VKPNVPTGVEIAHALRRSFAVFDAVRIVREEWIVTWRRSLDTEQLNQAAEEPA
jgi:hypothetical protein